MEQAQLCNEQQAHLPTLQRAGIKIAWCDAEHAGVKESQQKAEEEATQKAGQDATTKTAEANGNSSRHKDKNNTSKGNTRSKF